MILQRPYRQVNLDEWTRRGHFEVFGRGEYPYIGLTTSVDVTGLLDVSRESGRGFFNLFLYVVSRAMNSVENFRYRIYEDQVIVCETVDPSFNVLDPKTELFYFAYADYMEGYAAFDAEVERAKALALDSRNLASNRLDVMYVSCLPWFGFTDIIQPMGLSASDTIPRLLWGKYEEEGDKVTIPFSITGHHGLFDGLHIAKLLEAMNRLIEKPDFCA